MDHKWAERITSTRGGQLSVLAGGRIFAEGVSVATSLGAAHFLDEIYDMKPVKQVLAKVITPLVPALDKTADGAAGLETVEERSARHALSVDDRAYAYANTIFNYSTRIALSIGAQSLTQDAVDAMSFDKKPDVSVYRNIAIWDRVVQSGAIVLLNTALSKQNHQLQNTIAPWIEKTFDTSHDEARRLARDAVNIQIPNMIAMGLSLKMLDGAYQSMNA